MTRLSGGLIDRSQILNFKFDGKRYQGHPGDTLASALLANGVRLVGRSFKYHRPRGVLSAGSEEPNALVELRTGPRQEPNTRATTVELFEGLEARSQNRWPSLGFDAMAINDLFSPLFTAGFYYKTFMWPKSFWEKVYEPAIRRAAGLGTISMKADPDAYDKGFLHCDLLVIGGGPAGLAAALTAARAGARVILAEEDFRLGGRLLSETEALGAVTVADWVSELESEFESLPNLRVMSRTTVFGIYDHGIYGAVERVSDHLAQPGGRVRQTLWRITAKRAILAAGAIERPVAFADNDRPGIMLAGAMRAYANRWAACPSEKVAVFTNNENGHRTACNLAAKGVDIAAVIDARPEAKARGDYRLIAGGVVTGSRGRLGLTSIEVQTKGRSEWIDCGALGVSGGWNPNVHLASHHRGQPTWNEQLQAFLPGENGPSGLRAAGAAAGCFSTAEALRSGAETARCALEDMGIAARSPSLPCPEEDAYKIAPVFHVPGRKRAWVDFQNDVTVKDIKLAHAENMRPVEHLKRYTTLGMATDQGKTANVIGLAVMAELTGKTIRETGTTIFRPPYTPVAFAVLGGGDIGPHFHPPRLTPTHRWAEAQGAVFDESSPWRRADYFRREGETHWRQSVDREAQAVRSAVGLCDVSTLGKIDVQGTDAGQFLDRLYSNMMSTLKVGRVRYGLMLREDGFAYDDGTCARLADDHYVVTTTTGNAGLVYRNMDFARQCLWPELDVQLISTTEAWAQIAVAGPRSRALLERVVDGFDLSNEAFPFMACAEVTVCGGLRARLFRVSFVGELGYELAVPTRYGHALMHGLMEMGAELEVTPFGVEALSVLGMEKGHVGGAQLNGQTTAEMLGLGKMVSQKKDAIGAIMSRREGLAGNKRRLVGLQPVEPGGKIVVGSHLFAEGAALNHDTDQGWITSACYSPHVGSMIGLAFLENGYGRLGEVIVAANPVEGESARLRVVSSHFVDAEGVRLRG
ncbi:MAG: sarcosine oxidase subunit alpha family protein [Mesorhizobium sp.]|uniref:sarcosine oxidase subunit alpha family protein n=1 Tax=unclassified Mesorhizobium TaxID=325217 RepID=UPI000FE3502C|nr:MULTISPECIES: sarcosine oxidase subunit alpha family protein [unclassified Mesorhizobium]RWI34125.1 MAG: sarcosine oxidase subunit alpha family protein [Mesorhizobium sp.]RWI63187.1 MAG: sarcosine oxidase subunit alpha family protein [Mesorhizobium sp.]RWI82498.1 MAG: sarcosine oxidase subunit alpha family protein [Mesorhizobium sp.]RWJ43929.1 MAG: sarcosine oxidase subunit alpha family protein [Mesorhizobium sp.]RWJ57436.1 MAG: sarcosine oxidase subunit alpha family protein [Mesorhizobium 